MMHNSWMTNTVPLNGGHIALLFCGLKVRGVCAITGTLDFKCKKKLKSHLKNNALASPRVLEMSMSDNDHPPSSRLFAHLSPKK